MKKIKETLLRSQNNRRWNDEATGTGMRDSSVVVSRIEFQVRFIDYRASALNSVEFHGTYDSQTTRPY